MTKRASIYVETDIHTSMDTLWTHTQEPHLHTAWDLRFTSIDYIPKKRPEDDQHFHYETRIGFGLRIHGTGVSRGHVQKNNGERVSVLSFGSEQPLSLIKHGSGYWRYVPQKEADTVRFFTQYDYQTRWGKAGAWLDRIFFRPLIGWATAWSFDALRLWLEKGWHPSATLSRSLIHVLLVLTLAFVWIYQGLVPKLLFPESGEMAMWESAGYLPGYEALIVSLIGIAQIVFGCLFLLPIPKQRLFIASAIIVSLLGIGAWVASPQSFITPFNPAVLNITMVSMSVIGAINASGIALARRCRRKRKEASS